MMPSPMTRVEKLDNQMAMINSPDALRKLRGYQSMMQPPIIEREMGGVADVMPEEEAAVMQGAQQGAEQGMQIAQQVPPEMQEEYAGDVAQLKEAARGLAAMGRMGDTELVHMTADELQGLMSLGELTYNPVTGLPEAFKLGRIFKSITRAPKAIVKGVKNVAKSKAFKVLAPIVLGIAAPYALGASGLGLFSTTGALGFGAATALGTGLGSLLAGQKPSDALKSALISGVTAGIGKGISNKMAGQSFFKGVPKAQATGIPGTSGFADAPSYQQYANLQAASGTPITGGATTSNLAAGIPGVDASNIGQAVYPGGGVPGGGIPVPIEQAVYPGGASNIVTKPIITEQPGFFDKFSKLGSKDFYKDVGSAMKDDFLVPKDGGGISVLGTAKKVGKALIPTQLGEMAADASAMQREAEPLLTEEDYLNSPYKEMFPNYQSYTANYFKKLQPTQYADEASAVNRFVASGGGRPMETAAGGEFSGMVPGDGGGMEDNVYMPIKKGNEQVGTLAVSPSEYVVDSYTMAALGGGNAEEGAKVMDKTVEQIRKKAYGTTEQPNEIDGIRSLVPLQRSIG
jgi:hypothetical protein